MDFKYSQSTGLVSYLEQSIGTGYSGNGPGLNNPNLQGARDIGPIPQGDYTIEKFFDDLDGKGPVVAHLIPDLNNEMYGRSGFMIHGDNSEANHTASEGCIILPRAVREFISSAVTAGNNKLTVVE